MTMLRRLLSYGKKIFELPKLTEKIHDQRTKPRIPTAVVVRGILVMNLARLGSLNALEQTRLSPFWRRWLGAALPSADSLGRIVAAMIPDSIRRVQHEMYSRLKRNKALPPTDGGLIALVLDGHESHATYRRRCSGCLERTVKTKRGERIQYYHRHVTAMLLGGKFPLLLDAEPLRPGEDEIAPAIRLLTRILEAYPRAFDVVLGDAYYTDPRFYNLVLDYGKDVLSVLKANQPDLLADSKALFAALEPVELPNVADQCQAWDLSGFTSWPQVAKPVRVVGSRETTTVRRQLDGHREETVSTWMWVTTLSPHRASTATIVHLGHARWDIENRGFNETVNRWFADHVCKHDDGAILGFWLLAMIAFNLFHAFCFLNLKPVLRRRYSLLHIARCMASALYQDSPLSAARPP